jgi:xylulokinase
MTKTYFLGIDVSTTGSKALLVDESGNVTATATAPHTLQTPKPLWSEQDPGEWWQAAAAATRLVLHQAGLGGESVAAVGLTGQMHGLVLLDGQGQVLRPAILWNDQRTQSQCDEIHRRIGKEKFIRITVTWP